MAQNVIKTMTGYKATNGDMTCRGFKFELGKWYEHKGELKCCPDEAEAKAGKGGFHFCLQPSGVYAYYSGYDARVFKVEAEDVLESSFEPGVEYKVVARRIRLVEEITPGNRSEKATGD